jgi:hypothetical protein
MANPSVGALRAAPRCKLRSLSNRLHGATKSSLLKRKWNQPSLLCLLDRLYWIPLSRWYLHWH